MGKNTKICNPHKVVWNPLVTETTTTTTTTTTVKPKVVVPSSDSVPEDLKPVLNKLLPDGAVNPEDLKPVLNKLLPDGAVNPIMPIDPSSGASNVVDPTMTPEKAQSVISTTTQTEPEKQNAMV